ncbi:vWA domain-containing protein [Metabacillus schmidteae]|uniref:vWA domain-containing protein n=1 Tax=Metabacillus schmidteae TaxID=2730405 RepID=UPI00158AE185|nr:VWA domain-containing protein [Metabacillus schmidteae]
MINKYWLISFFSILLICGGCANTDDKQVSTANEKKNEQAAVNQEEKSQGELSKINELSTSVTVESLMEFKAGELTKDITYEEDTEQVLWGLEELEPQYINNMKEVLEPLTEEADDPETLMKALVYYAGSPSYDEIVRDLDSFTPGFNEPLLPRPEQVTKSESTGKENYSYILLDASSSMLLDSEGKLRMDIAKNAVESFAEAISDSSQVSLVAFGHRGDDSDNGKGESCSKIEEVYQMGAYDAKAMNEALTAIEAKGWTPLATAIEKTSEFSKNLDGQITIYIVSDGVETCDGNPTKAAEQFVKQKGEDNISVNIIGFQVDNEAENQLKAVANAGNGEYFAANGEEELLSTIEYEWLPSMLELTWAPVNYVPDGWEIFRETERVTDLTQGWTASTTRENQRFQEGLKIWKEQGSLTDETLAEVEELLTKREEELKKLKDELQERNKEKIDTKVNEIKGNVDKWVEEMKSLKEQAQ